MGIYKSTKQRISNFFSKSKSQILNLRSTRDENPALFSLIGNDYRFGTKSRDFLINAYGMNPYVFMVIDRISQRLVEIDKLILDSNDEEIESEDFEELLKAPNNKESGQEYLYRAASTFLVSGECFIVRVESVGEKDQYIVPINYNVIINEDVNGNVINYLITMFGESQIFLPNEVLHIHRPDITLDTNHGFSNLRALRKVWESNNEVWGSEAALHKNKGISGVLYSDGNRPMTETEQKQLQQKYDEDYTGSVNFAKVKVSTAKLGYVQMGMNPSDLKSIEARIEHLRTVCAAYNVSSQLFGDVASSTYNNMESAQAAMIINAVIPLSKIILPKMVKFMSRSVFQEYTMCLEESNIPELQIVRDKKHDTIRQDVSNGILSIEVAREMLYPGIEINTERTENGD